MAVNRARLAARAGEVIDRDTPVNFTWNGNPLFGFAGDTLILPYTLTRTIFFGEPWEPEDEDAPFFGDCRGL